MRAALLFGIANQGTDQIDIKRHYIRHTIHAITSMEEVGAVAWPMIVISTPSPNRPGLAMQSRRPAAKLNAARR
jgi:hypothetical protein